MPPAPPGPPSFSPRLRWKIGFDAALRTALVLAVVVMVNFLGTQFSHRFYLSSQTRVELSSRTVSLLHSLTNRVMVTLYYDRQDDYYPDIVALLNEYRSAYPKISVRTVDYLRDAGEAEKVKEQYKLDSATDKNLVIFDYDGRVKIAPGDALFQYGAKGISKDKKIEFGPVAFRGEETFTGMLLALEKPHPFQACFLQGHGEPSLADDGTFGYLKFASTLAQNYIAVTNLELFGDNPIPTDCNLLIIAAPTTPLSGLELQKIEQYLAQGGRLLALFNYASYRQPTGLEAILQSWGVNVVYDYVKDPNNTITGQDVIVRKFSQHPVVSPLAQLSLQMVLPRPIGRVDNPPADAPQVDELAYSGPNSTLAHGPGEPPRSYPLIVAVEQKSVAGVANSRGNTRIIVAGDSTFLDNEVIEGGANRDFLSGAVNWLLDRPSLLQGIGPRPVTEYRLLLTQTQRREVLWLLLGALPGAVLLLGGLVWLVRRK
ncbi:MAG TPA: GldG family protein [Verrucomicrobiae bacterium]|nr:GldG family protein [Verrucomicrobiae bacterium]